MEYKGHSMCSGDDPKKGICPFRDECYRFILHKEIKDYKFGYWYLQPEFQEQYCINKINKK